MSVHHLYMPGLYSDILFYTHIAVNIRLGERFTLLCNTHLLPLHNLSVHRHLLETQLMFIASLAMVQTDAERIKHFLIHSVILLTSK